MLRSLVTNVWWGARQGVLVGALFCAWVLVLVLVGGEEVITERYGLSVLALFAAYLVGGSLAGGVVGALRPLARRAWGAPLVGAIAALPVMAAMQWALDGRPPTTVEDFVFLGIGAIVFGGITGTIVYVTMAGKQSGRPPR